MLKGQNALTEGKGPEQLKVMEIFLRKALELFEKFTLWRVDTQKVWETQIPANLLEEKRYWLQADDGLDTLEDYAFGYARENIDDYTATFAEKKNRKSWANEAPTEKQVQIYVKLTGQIPPAFNPQTKAGWSKGELSNRINHVAAVKPVEAVVANFETRIDRLKEIV